MSKPRVTLGAESLSPGNGGICRVARMMGRVLAEEASAGSLEASGVVFSDSASAGDIRIPQTVACGSRPKFLMEVLRKTPWASHFIYDFIGMARAHCRVPMVRKPFMTFLHGVEIWEGTRRDRVAWARRADVLLINSAYTLERAERIHGKFARAKVCWLATEDDDYPSAPPETGGPPTVLIVARLDERRYKGHDALIEAWPKVVSAVPDARLAIVGKGPDLENMRRRVARNRVAANIDVAGFVPDAEIEQYWRRATVFAMPSMGEGFGLVYIEAMRYGLPVIGSVHDAAPEINLEGRTGYNIDLRRPQELADRLVHLLGDRDAAAGMGRVARQRWHDNFRFSAFRRRFREALWEYLQ